MRDDRVLVIDYFDSKSIEARPYPKGAEGKKPDFELFKYNKLFGLCELKSIVDYEFIGLRSDPTYNKIQDKIHKSSKQFKSVNSKHSYPNIVFFINHCENVGYEDLLYVLTGKPTFDFKYLKRLISRDDLSIIDFFIWADILGDKILYSINGDTGFLEELKEAVSSKAYERINIKSLK